MDAQCKVWILKGQPLRESDWLKQGYTSLPDYIERTIANHDLHTKKCSICAKYENLPLVTFGLLDQVEGEKKIVVLICKTLEELPTENVIAAIDDVDIPLIEFNA